MINNNMSPVRSSQPQENLTDQLASLQSAFSQLESSPASASNTFSPEVLQSLLRLVQNLINQLGKGKEDAGNVSTPSDDVNGSETVGVDAPLTSAIGQPGEDGIPEEEASLGVDGGDAPLTSAIGQPGEDSISKEEAPLGADDVDNGSDNLIGPDGIQSILPMNDSPSVAGLSESDVDNGSDNLIGPDGIQDILPMNDSPSVAGLSEVDLDNGSDNLIGPPEGEDAPARVSGTSFFDWFKENQGDINGNGIVDRADVTQWLKGDVDAGKGSDNLIGPPESDKPGSGYTIGSDGFPGAAPMSDSPGINH